MEDINEKLLNHLNKMNKLSPLVIVGMGVAFILFIPVFWIIYPNFDILIVPYYLYASIICITYGLWMYWGNKKGGIFENEDKEQIDYNESYGKLVLKEEFSSFLQNKKGSFMTSFYMFGIFASMAVMMVALPEITLSSLQKQLLLILYTILILIFMYFIFAGLYEYFTITQIKVYQNGFIPGKRLWRYVKDQKVMFIKWDEVIEVKDCVSSHSDKYWRVIFKVRDKGTYSLRENDTESTKKLREFLTELIDDKYPEAIHEEKFWM